jgi:hypothetical protein
MITARQFRLLILAVALVVSGCAGPGSESSDGESIYAFRERHEQWMKALREAREMGRSDIQYEQARNRQATPDSGAKLPVPLIRIDVVRNTVMRETMREKGAGLAYSGKNVKIVKPVPRSRDGMNIGASGGNWRGGASAGQQARESFSSSGSHLVVMDGGQGYLNIGTETPSARRIPLHGGGEAVVFSKPTTGHRLAVAAKIVPGGLVRVTVWPAWLAADRRTGGQKFEELSTSVVVRPGEPFEIGGFSDSGDRGGQGLFARRGGSKAGGSSVVLKATVLGGER